jgi:hypothetical protein
MDNVGPFTGNNVGEMPPNLRVDCCPSAIADHSFDSTDASKLAGNSRALLGDDDRAVTGCLERPVEPGQNLLGTADRIGRNGCKGKGDIDDGEFRLVTRHVSPSGNHALRLRDLSGINPRLDTAPFRLDAVRLSHAASWNNLNDGC